MLAYSLPGWYPRLTCCSKELHVCSSSLIIERLIGRAWNRLCIRSPHSTIVVITQWNTGFEATVIYVHRPRFKYPMNSRVKTEGFIVCSIIDLVVQHHCWLHCLSLGLFRNSIPGGRSQLTKWHSTSLANCVAMVREFRTWAWGSNDSPHIYFLVIAECSWGRKAIANLPLTASYPKDCGRMLGWSVTLLRNSSSLLSTYWRSRRWFGWGES